MNRCPRGLIAAAAIGLAALATAQPIDARRAAFLAGNCANCHGTHGRSAGATPSLAGLPKAQFIEAMQQFRDARREATVMHQHAKGYTAEETEALAEHFVRLPLTR